MDMMLRHQKTMLALRQQMGWPLFKPANDCIAFTSGKTSDFQVGMELGRIAQMLGKDLIYCGWGSVGATTPAGFTIAWRGVLTVDIIDRVMPYAANDEAPVVLVSTRADEHFAIDQRADVDAMKRILFARRRDLQIGDHPDFAVRPISEAWRLDRRTPAFKTAVANVAYIWRDSDAADRFGAMPAKFAERRCELRGAGLMLPASAPVWATKNYAIWEDADAATVATGDPTAAAGWHVMMEIPTSIRGDDWQQLVTGFVAQTLSDRGAGIAWAIHALEGVDGWIVNPHAHLIVTGLHWRRDYRHGQRHPAWIGSWQAQRRLELAWRRRCVAARLLSGVQPNAAAV